MSRVAINRHRRGAPSRSADIDAKLLIVPCDDPPVDFGWGAAGSRSSK